MTGKIDQFSEKSGKLCYWILIGMKSFFDFLTDSETKRKYYRRYWEKILERKNE